MIFSAVQIGNAGEQLQKKKIKYVHIYIVLIFPYTSMFSITQTIKTWFDNSLQGLNDATK